MKTVLYTTRAFQRVTFEVSQKAAPWRQVPGVYAFCRVEFRGPQFTETFIPVYIGETNNLCERIGAHEKWALAQHFGATAVLATVVPDAPSRWELERQLIQDLQPIINVEHRARSTQTGVLSANEVLMRALLATSPAT